jgi:hypothetical protein
MVLRLGSSRIEKEKHTFMSDVQTNIGFAEGRALFQIDFQAWREPLEFKITIDYL